MLANCEGSDPRSTVTIIKPRQAANSLAESFRFIKPKQFFSRRNRTARDLGNGFLHVRLLNTEIAKRGMADHCHNQRTFQKSSLLSAIFVLANSSGFAFRFMHQPNLPATTGDSGEIAGHWRYGLFVRIARCAELKIDLQNLC